MCPGAFLSVVAEHVAVDSHFVLLAIIEFATVDDDLLRQASLKPNAATKLLAN